MDFEKVALEIVTCTCVRAGGVHHWCPVGDAMRALQSAYAAGQRDMRGRAATAINERMAAVVNYEGTFGEMSERWGRQGAIAALQGALDAIYELEVRDE